MIRADASFEPPARESRELFGVRLVQDRNAHAVSERDLARRRLRRAHGRGRRDLLLGLVALKYTQSNSVGYALGGQMIGIGAGQQSRVDCTKLAGAKADLWHLRRHPKVLGLALQEGREAPGPHQLARPLHRGRPYALRGGRRCATRSTGRSRPSRRTRSGASSRELDGVSLVSDGFIPFRDNIDHAQRHGVRFIAEPGGSTRDDEVEAACREYGIALVHTKLRLFHH